MGPFLLGGSMETKRVKFKFSKTVTLHGSRYKAGSVIEASELQANRLHLMKLGDIQPENGEEDPPKGGDSDEEPNGDDGNDTDPEPKTSGSRTRRSSSSAGGQKAASK